MLDEMSPAQFDEWVAAMSIGLDLEGWQQAATVASGLQHELRVLVGCTQHRVPGKDEYRKPLDYLPKFLAKVFSPKADK